MSFNTEILNLNRKPMRRCFSLPLLVVLLATSVLTAQETHKYTNQLIEETSPYLLQHAHNPVDWQPWSDAAFAQAKEENKLVVVSIGYSSCHWCHAMEEETFSQEDVAQVMNQNFINIKVDREERPDVDQVYMKAVQLITGKGGWPLNVIVLPDGKPLYGGTYHKKDEWLQLLNSLSKTYAEKPEQAAAFAQRLTTGIQEEQQQAAANTSVQYRPELIETLFNTYQQEWDMENGGRKGFEKFMLPAHLNLLLDYVSLTQDAKSKACLEQTLDAIAMRGVYDHVSGGFFRYSVDPLWKIPHFEKMLSDNAQLISVYARAYTLFDKPIYRQRAEETITFLNNQFKTKDGSFIAALDADSDGKEGGYYLYNTNQLDKAITTEKELFDAYYTKEPLSRFETDILHLYPTQTDAAFAASHKLSAEQVGQLITQWKSELQQMRSTRSLPRADDKIIVPWNAMMISGLVAAAHSFEQPHYLKQAEKLYSVLMENAYKNGTLMHSYKAHSDVAPAFLDDYVFMSQATLDLFSSTTNTEYLDTLNQLINDTQTHFKDANSPFYTFNTGDELITNIITTNDGVQPSANALLAQLLFKLGHLNYNTAYLEQAKAMLLAMHDNLKEQPWSYTQWLALAVQHSYPFYEIAVVGPDAVQRIDEFSRQPVANRLLIGTTVDSELPLFESRFVPEKTYIYVCEGRACKLPVTTVAQALKQLEAVEGFGF
ncbi:MAG: thioredoxin domain-containing protein [Bacteroidota bacterium]|nr:thioredoxin domain-containing protein [Bacteroidota bacterium]